MRHWIFFYRSLLWLAGCWLIASLGEVTAFSTQQSLALFPPSNAKPSSLSSLLLFAQKPPIRQADRKFSPPPLAFMKSSRTKDGANQRSGKTKLRHSSLHSSSSPPSSVQVSIVHTLQALLHPQKKADLRKQLQQSYPLIPPPLLDSAMDVVSHALHSKLPSMLQECLRANGSWQHYQEEWKALLVQEALLLIPGTLVSHSLTRNVIEALIDLLLAQVLQSLELDQLDWMLSTPETRLSHLYDEIHTIQRTEMTRRQVVWFHFQRHRRRNTLIAAATLVTTSILLLLFRGKVFFPVHFSTFVTNSPFVLQQLWGRLSFTLQSWCTQAMLFSTRIFG